MIHQRFERLVVQRELPDRTTQGKIQWECLCDCNTLIAVTGSDLRSGRVKSCGCLKKEIALHLITTNPGCRCSGEDHHRWSGDDVGYGGLHSWVSRNKTKTGTCVQCGASPGATGHSGTHWANISGEYKRDLDDFRELCAPCNNAEKVAA